MLNNTGMIIEKQIKMADIKIQNIVKITELHCTIWSKYESTYDCDNPKLNTACVRYDILKIQRSKRAINFFDYKFLPYH